MSGNSWNQPHPSMDFIEIMDSLPTLLERNISTIMQIHVAITFSISELVAQEIAIGLSRRMPLNFKLVHANGNGF